MIIISLLSSLNHAFTNHIADLLFGLTCEDFLQMIIESLCSYHHCLQFLVFLFEACL